MILRSARGIIIRQYFIQVYKNCIVMETNVCGVAAWRVIVASLVFTVIGFIVHMVGAFAMIGYYLDPAYFCVWNRLLMPTAGPPPIGFTLASLGLGFVSALLFVFVYLMVRPVFKEKSGFAAGSMFGFGVFLVGGLPGSFMLWLLVNLPGGLIASYTIEALAGSVLGGALAGVIAR